MIKAYLLVTVLSFLLACNNQNSEIQKLSNSIEENTTRANEISKPLFFTDSSKSDYKFKRDLTLKQPVDSSLLQVMINAR